MLARASAERDIEAAGALRERWRPALWGVALVAAIAAACSANQNAGDVGTATATAGTPAPLDARRGADEAEYLAMFNTVTVAAAESTRIVNQFALFVATNDSARAGLVGDVRLLISSFELQRDHLEASEPVPERVTAAHDSLKIAIERYIEATSLLLPADEGGPERFEFTRFQETMQDGGKHFHGAGDLLP